MSYKTKNIINKIFAMANVKFVLEFNSYCSNKCECQREISIKSLSNHKKAWLDQDNTFKKEYDRIFVTAENYEKINNDTVCDVLLAYIQEHKLFKICCKNDNDEREIIFTIPNFSSIEELQIKLDLMI